MAKNFYLQEYSLVESNSLTMQRFALSSKRFHWELDISIQVEETTSYDTGLGKLHELI